MFSFLYARQALRAFRVSVNNSVSGQKVQLLTDFYRLIDPGQTDLPISKLHTDSFLMAYNGLLLGLDLTGFDICIFPHIKNLITNLETRSAGSVRDLEEKMAYLLQILIDVSISYAEAEKAQPLLDYLLLGNGFALIYHTQRPFPDDKDEITILKRFRIPDQDFLFKYRKSFTDLLNDREKPAKIPASSFFRLLENPT